jgi:hypothetical protein
MLRLTAGVDFRQIRRALEQLEIAVKLGRAGAHVDPLNPALTHDGDAIRQAAGQLAEPEIRLVHEFFWVWASPGDQGDPALAAMLAGKSDHAIELWSRAGGRNGQACVALHNRAVIHHALALESWLGQAGEARALRHWTDAYRCWTALLDDESFWSRVTTRIRELDDPRLPTGFARRLRACLPVFLLSIHAQIVARAADSNDAAGVKDHVRLMKESGLSPAARTAAFRTAADPVLRRIAALKERAVSAQLAGIPDGVREYVGHCRPNLEILDKLLGSGDASRDNAYDDVAETSLHRLIEYGNAMVDGRLPENWATCLAIYELVAPLPAGPAMRQRFEKNLSVVRSNSGQEMCWFCETRMGDDGLSFHVAMFGDVKHTTEPRRPWITTVTWRHSKVKVPRCSECADAQVSTMRLYRFWGAAAGFLLGLGGCSAAAGGVSFGPFVGGAVLGAIGFGIGSGIAHSRGRRGVKGLGKKNDFPRIAMLRKEGWSFGLAPLGEDGQPMTGDAPEPAAAPPSRPSKPPSEVPRGGPAGSAPKPAAPASPSRPPKPPSELRRGGSARAPAPLPKPIADSAADPTTLHKFSEDTDHIGAECPKCGRVLRIPKSNLCPAPAASTHVTLQAPVRCPCGAAYDRVRRR